MTAITVTSGDLANGRPWPSGNPVARAARRAFPDAWWVVAGLRSVTVIDRSGTRERRLPGRVTVLLRGWYAGAATEPFRFTLPGGEESGAAA